MAQRRSARMVATGKDVSAPRKRERVLTLTEKKQLAGRGRAEKPGTAFGSRWTPKELSTLRGLVERYGRSEAISRFVQVHPHRTLAGVTYQLDRGNHRLAA